METAIKNIITELFNKLEISHSIGEISEFEPERYKANIESPESSLLIGWNGANLRSLELIINLMLRKRYPDKSLRIILDINKYRTRQEENILKFAENKANQALVTNRPIILAPMSAYHRRLIHLRIAEKFPNIETESIGEGERRQVVIKVKE